IAAHANARPISMHQAAHLARREEDAVAHSFDAQKTVACAMRADGAFDDIARPHLQRVAARRFRCRALLIFGGLCCRMPTADAAHVVRAGGLRLAAIARPELRSTSIQLTAPDLVR